MSNAVVSFEGAPPPRRPVLPALGPDLDYAVDRVLHPRPGLAVAVVPDRVRAEAEAALPAFEAACRPMLGENPPLARVEAARRLVRDWLAGVAGAVRNPPDAKDLDLRAAAVLTLCGDLPAHLFNAETQREAMRSRFWPAAGDVDEALRPRFQELVAKRDALRRIAAGARDRRVRGAAAAPPPEPTPTDEERERVIARFRANLAAAQAEKPQASEPAPPKRVQAKHVTDEQLLAKWEAIVAEGGPAAGAAALRVAALRKKPGRG